MDLIKKANSLGYKHYTEFTIDELSKLSLNNPNKQIEYYFIQKWLREVHSINIYCMPCDELTGNIGKWYNNIASNNPVFAGTYEEALEKGLYQALLLIKN